MVIRQDPRRLGAVALRVVLPAPVEERHVVLLQRAVNLCTLKSTLAFPPAVTAPVVSRVAVAR